MQLAVGVRSSLDKSISLQWACGSRVFVCDNLAFRSERVIARKHTTHGVERYQEAISLRHLAGLEADEAAAAMGCTKAVLAVTLHRATKALRRAVESRRTAS